MRVGMRAQILQTRRVARWLTCVRKPSSNWARCTELDYFLVGPDWRGEVPPCSLSALTSSMLRTFASRPTISS